MGEKYAHIKKKERFQINDVTLYLKKLEKKLSITINSKKKEKIKMRVEINTDYRENRMMKLRAGCVKR